MREPAVTEVFLLRFLVAAMLAGLTCTGCGTVERFQKTLSYEADHPKAVLKLFIVPSIGMSPTIKRGQTVLADLSYYSTSDPKRGDIVVFMPPVPSSTPFAKRIIAIAGDRVLILGGKVYVNGRLRLEPYIKEHTAYDLRIASYRLEARLAGDEKWSPVESSKNSPSRAAWKAPDRVPSGYYLLLGDARNDSEDSHIFGFVARRALLGKIVELL